MFRSYFQDNARFRPWVSEQFMVTTRDESSNRSQSRLLQPERYCYILFLERNWKQP